MAKIINDPNDHYNDFDYAVYWKGREYEDQADKLAVSRLLSVIDSSKKNLVDIGAGFGRITPLYIDDWKNLYLIDPSLTQLELAKSNLTNSANIKFIIGSAQDIPLADKTCDTALCVRISHHIYDFEEVLTEVSRILEPGGYFLIEIANKLHFKNRVTAYSAERRDLLSSDKPLQLGTNKEGFVFVNHNPKTIISLLQKNGFQIIKALSVSNFRSPVLKRIFPTSLLMNLEKILQSPLARFLFGPSIYFLARKSKFRNVPKNKHVPIAVNNKIYFRLPIKTDLITEKDNLFNLLQKYVVPHLLESDIIFISEKVVAITQGRIIRIQDIRPTRLARYLARHVRNQLHTEKFKGFGHGTSFAMQLLLEEVGYIRLIFAAAVAAVTRPLGIRGLFYLICGKKAKSIDCPLSFALLPYMTYAKLPTLEPEKVAREIKEKFGHGVVIVDANYIGVFSLGIAGKDIKESFVKEVFRDNPLGQADELTPFCIVREAKI